VSVRSRLAAAAASLALLIAACGYRTGFTVPDAQSVAVEIFGNDSKERDLEVELHDHLTDALDRLIDAPIVTPERADLVIRGTVLEYARRGGIRNTDNVLLENGVRITVQARLVRPGEDAHEQVLRQLKVADDRGFLVEDPLGEMDARARVLRHIADRLVLDLFGDLAYEAPHVDPKR
jgi:hypothetical protein